MSSTRSANHDRVESAGDSAGQLLNRVFERHRVMQTFTDRVDHGLTGALLPRPAGPSASPGGLAYQTRTLDRDLTITTDGLAHIFSDNLANMYQGYVDGVANFDPWVPRSRRAV